MNVKQDNSHPGMALQSRYVQIVVNGRCALGVGGGKCRGRHIINSERQSQRIQLLLCAL